MMKTFFYFIKKIIILYQKDIVTILSGSTIMFIDFVDKITRYCSIIQNNVPSLKRSGLIQLLLGTYYIIKLSSNSYNNW